MRTLLDQKEKMIENFNKNSHTSFLVDHFGKKERKNLMTLLEGIFSVRKLKKEYIFNIVSALNELILNGIKANVKFLIFKKEIKFILSQRLKPDNLEILTNSILREPHLRESIQKYVVPAKLKRQTIKVLKLEKLYATAKDKLTKEETEEIIAFKQQYHKENIKNMLEISAIGENLQLTVRNDSPILKEDLERIHHSRSLHKKLYDEGRSHEYFTPKYLDSTESAGFGVAMSDEVYYSMNLNPLEHLFVETVTNHTKVSMKFPLSKFK